MPDYSVARVMQRTQESVGRFERHIERKNETYENMNVDLSRTDMNVHFKHCGDLTYNQQLEKMVADGAVSLRGLKADAKVFDEMIFDVNTDYFEKNGGYEYAKRFYEEAYHFAEKLYGKENIISAVMHADEVNLFMSDIYDCPVYHYHLHIMALPVVDKEIKWSKRCKNAELVGTVKEIIHQISHSKKWKSAKALDENGNPLVDKDGKLIYLKSYSVLQDKFFEYMQEAGFKGFERGERGSDTENLSCTQYKLEKDKERLTEIEDKIADADEKLSSILPVRANAEIIDNMGKKTLTGKVQMSTEDYGYLSNLAKECLVNRRTVQIYESSNRALSEKVKVLQTEIAELKEKCKPYLDALKLAPQKVKEFIGSILDKFRQQKSEQAKDIFYQPAEKKSDEPIRKPKTKKKEDLER